jgi:hypothetical protein
MTAAYFEVWDDATGNRVGGSFETLDAARALLLDVLLVNGADAAADMAILAFQPGADGRHEPSTIIEGADFVAQVRAATATTASGS